MTTLLSFDTSTSHTGYCVWHNAKYYSSGIVSSDPYTGDDRLEPMCTGIMKILNDNSPSIVVVERINVNRNLRNTRNLAEIIGVIRGWCYCHGSFFMELSPSEWRSSIGIQKKGAKRDYYKDASLNYVKEKYHKQAETDDESDAICIGEAYINIFSE